MKSLRLGTRKSLLAWAQSRQVARALEALHPGLQIELVGVETQGDRIQDVPLSQIEGREFFVKELDDGLLARQVDFTVHSLKDLSLDRPAGIRLGAIPIRENPRDVVVFSSQILKRLAQGDEIRIGTSAPRRLENLPRFLASALPSAGSARIQFKEIRGNVNTRLGRLHEAETSPKKCDGVVLALAGLNRLMADVTARSILQDLFKETRFMVLPLDQCPPAPGQGALAIECRAEDIETYEILHKLHDVETEAQVTRERKVLRAWGGGCHLSLGAVAESHPELGDLLFVRGRHPQGHTVEELQWDSPAHMSKIDLSTVWDGSRNRVENVENLDWQIPVSTVAIFVASPRAIPDSLAPGQAAELGRARIWVSGMRSWESLARRGFWVEGCAENLGFDRIRPTLQSPALALPALADWQILTHQGAVATWTSQNAVATYRLTPQSSLPGSAGDPLSAPDPQCDFFYWNSGSQFETYRRFITRESLEKAVHACGPGKTAARLRELGIKNLKVFPSSKEWRKWLGI